MNRFPLTMLFILATISGAAAHGGHLVAKGGHSHWIAVVAAVLTVAIAVGGSVLRLKKRKSR